MILWLCFILFNDYELFSFLIETDPITKEEDLTSVCVNKVPDGRVLPLAHHIAQRTEVKGLSIFSSI